MRHQEAHIVYLSPSALYRSNERGGVAAYMSEIRTDRGHGVKNKMNKK